jgi:putative oxidoreductase
MISIIGGPARLAQALDHLRSPLLLATRLWVSWQFLVSGSLKLTTWDVTLELFRSEYHVPLLPPAVAAVLGTFGELFFPTLLALGLTTRLGALGLSLVNAMAVVSYWHVLGAEGYEAALAQHVLWGFMLAVVAIFGGGGISLDRLYSAPTSKRASVDGVSAAGRTTGTPRREPGSRAW